MLCIRSLVENETLRPHFHPVLYPRAHLGDRYTNIYFGENQLSPGSVGILPLTTGHPMPLQRQRVRALPPISREDTLPMVSSPGFGSADDCFTTLSAETPYSDSVSLRLPPELSGG